MRGMIINASGPETLELEWPGQQPVLYAGGVPIFEIWFHDAESDLWFAMTATPQAPTGPAGRGGIGFHPAISQSELRGIVDAWRRYARESTRAPRN